tara:strand:- start:154 stop:804 length:651 start_codon:yes stop_codon:yes gene_type:complete
MKALLFGSIGVLAETSELQRQAYNTAFKINDLKWHWNIGTYCSMLTQPGGLKRLTHFFGGTLNDSQITKIHRDKQAVFEQLVKTGIRPRPGCVDLIQHCRKRHIKLAFLTTTTPHTLAIIKAGLAESIDFNDFELITNMDAVDQLKPDPEVFLYALRILGLSASQAIAIEDTKTNQQAAIQAGVRCYLFPGEYATLSPNIVAEEDIIIDDLRTLTL